MGRVLTPKQISMTSSTTASVIVVGAGAAGLMAGIFAARSGASVIVLETRPRPGAKIRVSGGGRCNVLPSKVALDDYHTAGSAHSLRNILFSWPLDEVRAFFESDLGIPLKVEPSGKVFPQSDRSRDVVDALLDALRRSGAELRSQSRVGGIVRRDDGRFEVAVSGGEPLECGRLVLATGGLALPKSGSDGAGLEMAAGFGHRVTPTYPALVPLFSRDLRLRALSGLSVRARISVERGDKRIDEREGDFLFTHRGFSGPVVLDVSRYVTQGDSDIVLRVHWGGSAVGDWETVLLEGGKATVGSAIRRHLPDRLVVALVRRVNVESSTRLSELKREARRQLVDTLERFELPVRDSEGYTTAEVTGGGIPLDEIRPATLESRLVPGLHFCGEMLDVTGRLGGYNFLWAWVTGRNVGRAVSTAR